MNISKSLKIALIHKDKSQKWLALELGVSNAYISAIANNKKSISLRSLNTISSTLDIKASEFIRLGE